MTDRARYISALAGSAKQTRAELTSTKPSMSKSTNSIPLLVTTSHKGVFFGYGQSTENNIIRIERARMCVYWSADCHGVLGLASTGPTQGCKIGPEVPAITLRDVTSVTEVSDGAAAAWSKEPWN